MVLCFIFTYFQGIFAGPKLHKPFSPQSSEVVHGAAGSLMGFSHCLGFGLHRHRLKCHLRDNIWCIKNLTKRFLMHQTLTYPWLTCRWRSKTHSPYWPQCSSKRHLFMSQQSSLVFIGILVARLFWISNPAKIIVNSSNFIMVIWWWMQSIIINQCYQVGERGSLSYASFN